MDISDTLLSHYLGIAWQMHSGLLHYCKADAIETRMQLYICMTFYGYFFRIPFSSKKLQRIERSKSQDETWRNKTDWFCSELHMGINEDNNEKYYVPAKPSWQSHPLQNNICSATIRLQYNHGQKVMIPARAFCVLVCFDIVYNMSIYPH